jgi:hypothetical protein
MSLFDDVKKLAGDAVDDIEGVGDDLKNDFSKGVDAVSQAIVSLKNKLEQDAENLESDLVSVLLKLTGDVSKYYPDVKLLASAVAKTVATQAYTDAASVITDAVENKQLTDDVWTKAQALYQDIVNAAGVSADFVSKFTTTFSVSYGGEVAAAVSLDGLAGLALKTDKSDYRYMVDVSVGMGGDFGADLEDNIGFFSKSPRELKGSFFAMEAAAEDVGGAGVGVVFEFPSMDLIGFRFLIGAGEEIEIGTMLGYTETWDAPATAAATA